MLSTDIDRLLAHFSIRPTYEVGELIYASLKKYGYAESLIPSVPSSMSRLEITTYCGAIRNILKTTPLLEEKKRSQKETFVYEESNMLPNNVYTAEDLNSDRTHDDGDDMSIISETDSESCDSEQENSGYELYNSESDDFSE